MGRMIDVDDLIDAAGVATLCGLASRKVVAANRGKGVGVWSAFPEPVVDLGWVQLWDRQEVEAWDVDRKANPRKRGPKAAGGNASE